LGGLALGAPAPHRPAHSGGHVATTADPPAGCAASSACCPRGSADGCRRCATTASGAGLARCPQHRFASAGALHRPRDGKPAVPVAVGACSAHRRWPGLGGPAAHAPRPGAAMAAPAGHRGIRCSDRSGRSADGHHRPGQVAVATTPGRVVEVQLMPRIRRRARRLWTRSGTRLGGARAGILVHQRPAAPVGSGARCRAAAVARPPVRHAEPGAAAGGDRRVSPLRTTSRCSPRMRPRCGSTPCWPTRLGRRPGRPGRGGRGAGGAAGGCARSRAATARRGTIRSGWPRRTAIFSPASSATSPVPAVTPLDRRQLLFVAPLLLPADCLSVAPLLPARGLPDHAQRGDGVVSDTLRRSERDSTHG